MKGYAIANADGVEEFVTLAGLFDGLVLRGNTAAEAVVVICQLMNMCLARGEGTAT